MKTFSFLCLIVLGLLISSCKEDELSGVWYLYKSESLRPLENPTDFEITRNISDLYKKAGENCKYNFNFNVFEINGNEGSWNKGSLFRSGWDFEVIEEKRQLKFTGPNCEKLFEYQIVGDTLKIHNGIDNSGEISTIYEGVKIAENKRNMLREFLAGSPTKELIDLPLSLPANYENEKSIPDQDDYLVFYSEDSLKSCWSIRDRRNRFFTKNGIRIQESGLTVLLEELKAKEEEKLFLFTSRNNIEELRVRLNDLKLEEDLLRLVMICCQDEIGYEMSCYQKKIYFNE
ncbi:MAG: hypothetical protein MRY83_10390 [Flavobacteriales bacterium]|nr:hypothetical protein [Flavobacteriales bacterium]